MEIIDTRTVSYRKASEFSSVPLKTQVWSGELSEEWIKFKLSIFYILKIKTKLNKILNLHFKAKICKNKYYINVDCMLKSQFVKKCHNKNENKHEWALIK